MKTSLSKGIWIPEELCQNEDLTVMEKLFVVKINALDGKEGCYASNSYFSDYFKLSKSRCSVIIKSLKEKGYIVIKYFYEKGKKLIERRIIKIKKDITKFFNSANETEDMDRKNESSLIIENKEGIEDLYLDSYFESDKELIEIHKKVVGYLNEKCSTNYKYTIEKTKKSINDRIKEGNTLQDFREVIDKKCEEWIDTNMSIYLRPETLFGEKFERYLNEEIIDKEIFFNNSKYNNGQAYKDNFSNSNNTSKVATEELNWEYCKPFFED